MGNKKLEYRDDTLDGCYIIHLEDIKLDGIIDRKIGIDTNTFFKMEGNQKYDLGFYQTIKNGGKIFIEIDGKLSEIQSRIVSKEHLEELEDHVSTLSKKADDDIMELLNKEEEIIGLNSKIEESNELLLESQHQIDKKEAYTAQLNKIFENKNKAHTQEIENKNRGIEKALNDLQTKENEYITLKESFNKSLEEKSEIESLVESKQKELDNKLTTITDLESQIKEKDKELKRMNKEYSMIKKIHDSSEEQTQELTTELKKYKGKEMFEFEDITQYLVDIEFFELGKDKPTPADKLQPDIPYIIELTADYDTSTCEEYIAHMHIFVKQDKNEPRKLEFELPSVDEKEGKSVFVTQKTQALILRENEVYTGDAGCWIIQK